MRRFIFFLIPICCIVCAAASCIHRGSTPTTQAKLYYIDSEINRLLPYDDELPDTDAEHQARAALEKLRKGRRDNDKIRRLMPQGENDITVYTNGDVAYVNLKSKIAGTLPDSRDIERLFVYQIVDTLTSIKGIRFVKFTVDGRIHKTFMGYLDMRETFKYTYPE